MKPIPYKIRQAYEEQIPDYDDDVEYIEPYEPTEEEIEEYYREKAERYWRNKW